MVADSGHRAAVPTPEHTKPDRNYHRGHGRGRVGGHGIHATNWQDKRNDIQPDGPRIVWAGNYLRKSRKSSPNGQPNGAPGANYITGVFPTYPYPHGRTV